MLFDIYKDRLPFSTFKCYCICFKIIVFKLLRIDDILNMVLRY